jgi:hypothetical protein
MLLALPVARRICRDASSGRPSRRGGAIDPEVAAGVGVGNGSADPVEQIEQPRGVIALDEALP